MSSQLPAVVPAQQVSSPSSIASLKQRLQKLYWNTGNYKLNNKYVRGVSRDIAALYADFQRFYDGMEIPPLSQLQKVFNGKLYDVCFYLPNCVLENSRLSQWPV